MNIIDRYNDQKDNAKRRGIPFLLTFEQWLQIWKDSGHLDQRGRKRDEYCMARYGDIGAYEVGNVHIILSSQNMSETVPYIRTEEWKQDLSNRMKGKQYFLGQKHSEETRQKISESNKGRIGGFEGKKHSEETKELKRRTWRNQYGSAQDKK